MTVNLPTAKTLQTRIALLTEDQRDALFSTMTASWDGVHATDAVWRRAIATAELPTLPADGFTVTHVGVQTTECSRCGGTGHFSFNQLTGTRCFRCNGAQLEATKLGQTARDAIAAWKVEHLHVLVTDLAVGDRFVDSNGKTRTLTVAVSAPKVTGRSRSGGDDAPWVDMVTVTVTTQRVTISVPADRTVQRAFSPETFRALVRFAATLPGAVFTIAPIPAPETPEVPVPETAPDQHRHAGLASSSCCAACTSGANLAASRLQDADALLTVRSAHHTVGVARGHLDATYPGSPARLVTLGLLAAVGDRLYLASLPDHTRPTCAWYAMCDLPADGTLTLLDLTVPCCLRCATHVGAEDQLRPLVGA